MQAARFVRAFGLFLVLYLAGFGAGCGSGGTGEKKEGNVVKEEQRTYSQTGETGQGGRCQGPTRRHEAAETAGRDRAAATPGVRTA